MSDPQTNKTNQRDDISQSARSLARIADRLPNDRPVVITLVKSDAGWDIRVSEMTRRWTVRK